MAVASCRQMRSRLSLERFGRHITVTSAQSRSCRTISRQDASSSSGGTAVDLSKALCKGLAVSGVFSGVTAQMFRIFPTMTGRACLSGALACMVILNGLKKGSLTPTGGAAAGIVAMASLMSHVSFGSSIIAFYFLGSAVSKVGKEAKEAAHWTGDGAAGRNWAQVLCTAAVPTVLAALHAHMVGNSGPAITNPLVQGFLASCACACGDTFASEVGMLSGEHPKSILSLQRMRAGTNGAVTLVGTLASGVGGGLVGVVFCGAALVADASAYPLWQSFLWRCLSVGLLGGVIGTTLDSFLGATVQFSGWCKERQKVVSTPGASVEHLSGSHLLTNSGVNLLSSLLTALVAMALLR